MTKKNNQSFLKSYLPSQRDKKRRRSAPAAAAAAAGGVHGDGTHSDPGHDAARSGSAGLSHPPEADRDHLSGGSSATEGEGGDVPHSPPPRPQNSTEVVVTQMEVDRRDEEGDGGIEVDDGADGHGGGGGTGFQEPAENVDRGLGERPAVPETGDGEGSRIVGNGAGDTSEAVSAHPQARTSLTSQIESLIRSQVELETRSLRSQLDDATNEVEAIRSELEEARSTSLASEDTVKRYRDELSKTREELGKAQSASGESLGRLEAEMQRTRKELESTKRRLEGVHKKYRSMKESAKKKDRMLKSWHEQMMQLQAVDTLSPSQPQFALGGGGESPGKSQLPPPPPPVQLFATHDSDDDDDDDDGEMTDDEAAKAKATIGEGTGTVSKQRGGEPAPMDDLAAVKETPPRKGNVGERNEPVADRRDDRLGERNPSPKKVPAANSPPSNHANSTIPPPDKTYSAARRPSNGNSLGGKRGRSTSPTIGAGRHRRSDIRSIVASASRAANSRQDHSRRRKSDERPARHDEAEQKKGSGGTLEAEAEAFDEKIGRDSSTRLHGSKGKENRENWSSHSSSKSRATAKKHTYDPPIPSFTSSQKDEDGMDQEKPSSSGATRSKQKATIKVEADLERSSSDEETEVTSKTMRRDGVFPSASGERSPRQPANAPSTVPRIPYSKKDKGNVTSNASGKNSDGGRTASSNAANRQNGQGYKYQEVVRCRDARRAMPGHDCEQCSAFLNAVCGPNGGGVFDRDTLLADCSRHRAQHSPDHTPDGYWELSFADSIAARKHTRDSP